MNRNFWMMVLLVAASCGTDGASNPGADAGQGCTPGQRAACECSPGSTGVMTCGADERFGACGSCSAPDPDPTRVNFQTQIVPIFERSCGAGGVSGCHGRDAYGANLNQDCRGWLTLENAALGSKFYSGPNNGQNTGCPDTPLYDRLTQIDVWQCVDTPVAYVTPGDVSQSYLMNKLNGVGLCQESASSPSEQMPPTDSLFSISAADKALIEQWITEGALNN